MLYSLEGKEANLKCNAHVNLHEVLIIGVHRTYIISQKSSDSKMSLRKLGNATVYRFRYQEESMVRYRTVYQEVPTLHTFN